jgi:glycosyltransferase involved in cell wall biosynthesis
MQLILFKGEHTENVWNKLACIVFGVDPEMFKPLEISEEKFILSVGTFTPEKGHGFLVDSLAINRS